MVSHSNASIRKAAILLMSLPQEEAARLLSKLEPKQVEQVSIEIAKLGRVTSDEQAGVIHEFADENPNALGGESGSLDLARSLRKQQTSLLPAILDCHRCRGRLLDCGESCPECGNPLWKYNWLTS